MILGDSGAAMERSRKIPGKPFTKIRYGRMKILRRGLCEIIEDIEVRGADEFRARTREALSLLAQTPGFLLVQTNVKIIRQGKRSGMNPRAEKPVFVVGDATWRHSPIWYAGAIAHDAYHAELYRSAAQANGGGAPYADAWTGVAAEKKCLAFQYNVLRALHGDARTLDYVARCAGNPIYQGRTHGLGGRLDYLRRWW